jgi:hypothetical protein
LKTKNFLYTQQYLDDQDFSIGLLPTYSPITLLAEDLQGLFFLQYIFCQLPFYEKQA